MDWAGDPGGGGGGGRVNYALSDGNMAFTVALPSGGELNLRTVVGNATGFAVRNLIRQGPGTLILDPRQADGSVGTNSFTSVNLFGGTTELGTQGTNDSTILNAFGNPVGTVSTGTNVNTGTIFFAGGGVLKIGTAATQELTAQIRFNHDGGGFDLTGSGGLILRTAASGGVQIQSNNLAVAGGPMTLYGGDLTIGGGTISTPAWVQRNIWGGGVNLNAGRDDRAWRVDRGPETGTQLVLAPRQRGAAPCVHLRRRYDCVAGLSQSTDAK